MTETIDHLAAAICSTTDTAGRRRREVRAMTPMTAKRLLCAAVMTAISGAASAHVTVQPREAAAGSYFQMAFVVPHGCDGTATVAIRVKMPDGLTSVRPKMKPGWTVEIKTRNLDTPLPG